MREADVGEVSTEGNSGQRNFHCVGVGRKPHGASMDMTTYINVLGFNPDLIDSWKKRLTKFHIKQNNKTSLKKKYGVNRRHTYTNSEGGEDGDI
jgi:hypothetical protein